MNLMAGKVTEGGVMIGDYKVPVSREIMAKAAGEKTLTLGIRPEAFVLSESGIGVEVALVSFDLDAIGAMSCNPAIGGLGKGHLVREVDAFDGLIGRAADTAASGGIRSRNDSTLPRRRRAAPRPPARTAAPETATADSPQPRAARPRRTAPSPNPGA